MLQVQYDVKLEASFKAYDYQNEALLALQDLSYGAVFHEQGLGKTKIAVDLALYWLDQNIVDSVFIVTKKGLIANWEGEIATHTNTHPCILTGNRTDDYYSLNSPARIYLLHYEVSKGQKDRLKHFLRTRRVGIILDESHKLKNPNSMLTKAYFELSDGFCRKIIMSGTPIANRPYDVWAQVYFLDHGKSLGDDFEHFKATTDLNKELEGDLDQQNEFTENVMGIFGAISDFSVRETKLSAGIELPEKTYEILEVDFEPIQLELYERYRDEFRSIILKDGKLIEDNAEAIVKRILRLVQIASNPALVDENYDVTPGKFDILYDEIEKIVDRGEKVIVWTNFTANADWLASSLAEFSAAKTHGKMDIERRNRNIEKFKSDPECKVLVATPGAAKEGLTLTVANHTIFYDRGLSLDDYLQSQDRIHRISQTKKCHVLNLVMKGSIDEWVASLLLAKQLAAQLGQGDIDASEFSELATFDFSSSLKRALGVEDEASD